MKKVLSDFHRLTVPAAVPSAPPSITRVWQNYNWKKSTDSRMAFHYKAFDFKIPLEVVQ